MSWFDEQLRERKKIDEQNYEASFIGIAGAVMGKKLTAALEEKQLALSAIDEILRFYKCKIKDEPLPKTAMTVEEQLDYRLRPYGIMHREVLLEEGWYTCTVGAMLGTLKEDGRVVALIPNKIAGYSYYDFATGQKVKINKKTAQFLDERATCFYKPLPMKKLKIKDLLLYMKDQLSVSDVALFLIITAIVTVIGMLAPAFTNWLFGPVLESKNVMLLVSLAVFMIAFSITQLLINAYKTLVLGRVEVKMDIAVQAAVMSRILSLPTSFFKEYSSGELTARSGYVQSLCNCMMNAIANTGLTSVFSLVYLGQIFLYAPKLVLPSVIITLVTIAFSMLVTFRQMKISKEEMELSSKESGMSYAMITGVQKIKLAGAEKRMFGRWAKLYQKTAKLAYNPPALLKFSGVISTAISLVGMMVTYYIAVKSRVSVADYYAFNSAYGMVSGAFMSLAGLATTIANIKPTLEMAKPIMEAEPEMAEGKEIITSLQGGIEINNVTFRYKDDMPNVLENFSLKVRPGEYLGIVGKTGCGKSTLMRILLGFETPQKGAVYFDKKDVSRVDTRSLRRKIGTVMQNGRLFMGDIFSNIIIAAPETTLEGAWAAAETASIADDIRAMPMGMNTFITEGQGGISGGQKQRLMIARAVAGKPRILMFDEATSALDNVTQKHVSEAIDKLKCTRLVIAHRLSTIKHCDRIIVIDGGKIVEEGNYEELIAKNGFFAELVARQRVDVEEEQG